MKRITLIDGNSLMFRAYYATAYSGKLMQTKAGLYTNAVHAFCNMLNNLIVDDEYIFIAFDAGKATFRHKEYSEYKGGRKALPDELRVQIPYIKKFIDIMKLKREESLDYEADDLIASAANLIYNDFDEIRVISGDRDLLQLVNNKVKVFLTKRGITDLEEYNSENFHEKMGIYPNQVIDYKGLVGDASDNLPGIKGIGEKTAIKLLDEFTSLDEIIKNTEALKGKLKEQIEENYQIGLMCKKLATLKIDVLTKYEAEDFKTKNYSITELKDFYRELEFYSFLKKMEQTELSDKLETSKVDNDTIKEGNNLETIVIIDNKDEDISKYLQQDSYICAEVFRTNYYTGEFLGISLVSADNEVFFTKDVVVNNQALIDYLENDQYQKKTYDYKLLYSVLKQNNIIIKNVSFDLLLAVYLVNPSYSEDDFKKTADNISIMFENSGEELGTVDISYYDNIYGANTKMKIPDSNIYAKYSINKCLIIRNLEKLALSELKTLELLELFNVELQLSLVLGQMELDGLAIDIRRLEDIGKEFTTKLKEVEADIYFIAGVEFNINSPKQLAEILFERLNLPHPKKGKTAYSTGVEVLEKLAVDFKIAQDVLEYRKYAKLISTYVNSLKDQIDSNNYIHPLYRQANTVTGRLSSIEPNIQNMPIRSEEGQVIREIFVSRFEGGKIISADYSQIELRILAHLANDEKMIQAFNSGTDFHKATAAILNEKPLDEVTKEMRRTAKAINFGIIYGMSAWGLSENLGISPLEANIYINKYFNTYKNVKTYLDGLVSQVKVDGYVSTIYNRRRYIPEATNTNINIRNFGERTAMNAPMQGSAADIIKVAMNKISDRLIKENRKTLMIAQVHDELLFDAPIEEVEAIMVLVKEEMENVIKLNVPLLVEANSGDNWALTK